MKKLFYQFSSYNQLFDPKVKFNSQMIFLNFSSNVLFYTFKIYLYNNITITIMFRKNDFKKIELLGSGKKHTKIYKVVHNATGKIYALKQIQAKSMDKLNQYKQQAVQLMKVQNHNNVIKFYGYYMTETMYNAFRLGIVTQFMDHHMNVQNIYRKRRKANQFWKQKQLVTMYCSIISTCAFLQDRGICHRDIKPANIFLLANNQLKLIDFGQSKDYFYDIDDQNKNTYTMATIRGTPQYLSPILWKAHVIDGQSRYAEHNIYKSDVFSTGLVLFQLASMNEVNGFNSKTKQVNGEELIKENLKNLQKTYSPQFIQILDILLRFDESQRPSFSEIQKLFLQRQLISKQQGKQCNQYIKFYNQNYNNLSKLSNTVKSSSLALSSNMTTNFKQQTQTFMTKQQKTEELKQEIKKEDKKQQPLSQSNKQPVVVNKIFKPPKQLGNFYKDSTLILHQSCYWFEFGGSSIGRFSINKLKWKIDPGIESKRFPLHFSVVYIPQNKSYFLLGGPLQQNFRVFQSHRKLILNKNQMPTFRNFFSTVYYNQKVYVFGGYQSNLKVQIRSCQMYQILTGKWNAIANLKIPRSQSAACRINDQYILVFGGYNKEHGTLDSIERYNIEEDKFDVLSLKLPIPLRRFMVVRITKNVALVLGGLTKNSKQSQRVFKLDFQKQNFIQLQNLQKGGVIQNEVLVDQEGNLHIFLEHGNGTSPHSHIKYSYDPNDQKYATKVDI